MLPGRTLLTNALLAISKGLTNNIKMCAKPKVKQKEKYYLMIYIEPAKATGSMVSPLYGWMYVCMDVCNELISETAPPISLKLGMKLGDNKGKKIAGPDF